MRRTRNAFSNRITSYLTDVEGCLDHWNQFLKLSKVISRDPVTNKICFLPSVTPTCFVFGGDAFDKGIGDLTIAEELVDFKRSFPDRVFLIIGNRDLNKLKLTSELGETALQLDDPPRPYYLPLNSYVSLPQFLAREKEALGDSKPLPSWMDSRNIIGRLRYHLKHTMGSAEAFEFRRQELEMRKQISISDEDVLRSYLDALLPGGAFFDYMKEAQIAAVVGDSLFVHGSVNDEAVGFVPDYDALEERRYEANEKVPGINVLERGETISDWVAQLNLFKDRGFNEWNAKRSFEQVDGRFIRGGGPLLGYGHMAVLGRKTVTVSNFLDPETKSLSFVGLKAVAALNHAGISRVASGHQPTGDTPSIISQPGLTVVLGDNSYCDQGSLRPPNGRGGAISEILLIESETGESSISIHGQRCKAANDSQEQIDFTFNEDDHFIGRCFPASKLGPLLSSDDNWCDKGVFWGKARRVSSEGRVQILVQRTFNAFYQTEYHWVDEEALQSARTPLVGVGMGQPQSTFSQEELTNSRASTERLSLFKAKTRPLSDEK